MTINLRGKRGFTLIEVMVALLILAVGMMALVIGIMKALDYSLMDEMRKDAIKIAQEQQEAARNMDYNAIPQIPATAPGGQQITREVRKQLVPYTVFCTLPPPPAAAAGLGGRIVEFKVQWKFKGITYTYDQQTIVRQMR